MRILLDTNILLDVLLDRQPHADASAAVVAAVDKGVAQGLLAAHAVTTIHYLIRREMSAARARKLISSILAVFEIAAIDEVVIHEALQLSCPDFEDAVTAAAARMARCDYIVTREPKGFQSSPIRSLTPEGVAPLLTRG